jgi:hypothetical protein
MGVNGAAHAPEEMPLQAEWLMLGFCPGLPSAVLGVGPPAEVPALFFLVSFSRFLFPIVWVGWGRGGLTVSQCNSVGGFYASNEITL